MVSNNLSSIVSMFMEKMEKYWSEFEHVPTTQDSNSHMPTTCLMLNSMAANANPPPQK